MGDWETITECNDPETNEEACWASIINNKLYGKFAWISNNYKNGFDVEVMAKDHMGYEDIVVLKTCKSVISAKRWVTSNLR